MDEWFYYKVGLERKLQSTWKAIKYIPQPKIAIDGSTRSRMTLLRTIAQKATMRDLVEEFCGANI